MQLRKVLQPLRAVGVLGDLVERKKFSGSAVTFFLDPDNVHARFLLSTATFIFQHAVFCRTDEDKHWFGVSNAGQLIFEKQTI